MKTFNSIKAEVKKLFAGRPGFTEEVFDAIAHTYYYLSHRYPQSIAAEKIPDSNTFRLNPEKKEYTIAEIYLNRIFNNVQEFVHDHGRAGETASQFEPKEKRVYVPAENHYSWDKRMLAVEHVAEGYDIRREEIRKKIRAKVIVHELLHAGSFNGEAIGFILQSDGGAGFDKEDADRLEEKYNADIFDLCYGVTIEELVTEELALDVVGGYGVMNVGVNEEMRYTDQQNKEYTIPCRNPESSNGLINALGVYIMEAYPEVQDAKFSNGIEFLGGFAIPWGANKEVKSLAINTLCDDILEAENVSIFDGDVEKKVERNVQRVERVINLQKGCLIHFLQNFKIETLSDLKKAKRSWRKFYTYAISRGGYIASELKVLLDKIHSKIHENEKMCAVEDVKRIDREIDIEENNYIPSEPYSHMYEIYPEDENYDKIEI